MCQIAIALTQRSNLYIGHRTKRRRRQRGSRGTTAGRFGRADFTRLTKARARFFYSVNQTTNRICRQPCKAAGDDGINHTRLPVKPVDDKRIKPWWLLSVPTRTPIGLAARAVSVWACQNLLSAHNCVASVALTGRLRGKQTVSLVTGEANAASTDQRKQINTEAGRKARLR